MKIYKLILLSLLTVDFFPISFEKQTATTYCFKYLMKWNDRPRRNDEFKKCCIHSKMSVFYVRCLHNKCVFSKPNMNVQRIKRLIVS